MSNFTMYLPVRIVFGEGQLATIGAHTKPLGSRALLVADAYWVESGLTDRIAGLLQDAGVETVVTSEFSPNPLCSEIDALGGVARAESADVVVGLGGGSAIDTAKAVAVIATHEGSIDDYVQVER